MKAIPSYTKILTIGSSMTENALVGPVVIQEKLDGSQFSFGFNEDGEFVMRSKGVALYEENYAEMFKEGVEYVLSIKDKLLERFNQGELRDIYFYSEYLRSPKHNILKYDRTPKNYICLFDILSKGAWLPRAEIEAWADILGVEVIPQIWSGILDEGFLKDQGTKISTPGEFLKNLSQGTISFLAGDSKLIAEGVVIKNYEQTLLLGGHIFPLFTKFVREEFKEKHAVEWAATNTARGSVEEYIKGFTSTARWDKAIIHRKEKGELLNEPKDIGPLMEEIHRDIEEEEQQNIKDFLYKAYIKDIKRLATKGFPMYYKEKLLENLKK